MNKRIKEIEDKILSGNTVTKEEVIECQQIQNCAEDLFHTYWIMSRYYLNCNNSDALTYCILRCYELHENNKFDLDFKVKDFMEVRCDFMEEAIKKTRTKLIPISAFFGVIVLVAFWLILGNGNFGGFVIGFLAMNIVSIKFQDIGFKKTITTFKKRQLNAVYSYLDEQDKKFVDEH